MPVVVPGFTDGIGDFWTNISILPSSNVLAGTISISDILKSLIWHGVITGQEYLSGIEFGPEPGAGSGSLTRQQSQLSMERYPHHRVDCRK